MTRLSQIKNAIKTTFNGLITDGVIKNVIIDDLKTSNLFDREMAPFPCAVITSPTIDNQREDRYSNMRTYTFEVAIVCNGEDLSSPTDVEEVMELVIDKFDNAGTLGGLAEGQIDPSTTNPAPITVLGKTYIVFSIIIKAKALFAVN